MNLRKLIDAALCLVFTLEGVAYAGTIRLSPGSSVVVQANEETTVLCSGNGGGMANYKICNCEEDDHRYDLVAKYYSGATLIQRVTLARRMEEGQCIDHLRFDPLCRN